MGAGIEYGIGFGKMSFLYLITGFGGNLLSSVINPVAYGVGASTAVFGLVGFYVAYIFTNWQYMSRDGKFGQKIFLIVFTSFLILLNLNIGPGSDKTVDNWGHLGGLITGILAGFVIAEWFDLEASSKDRNPDRFTAEEYENKNGCLKSIFCRFCGIFFLTLWIVGLLVIFYVYIDTDDLE